MNIETFFQNITNQDFFSEFYTVFALSLILDLISFIGSIFGKIFGFIISNTTKLKTEKYLRFKLQENIDFLKEQLEEDETLGTFKDKIIKDSPEYKEKQRQEQKEYKENLKTAQESNKNEYPCPSCGANISSKIRIYPNCKTENSKYGLLI